MSNKKLPENATKTEAPSSHAWKGRNIHRNGGSPREL